MNPIIKNEINQWELLELKFKRVAEEQIAKGGNKEEWEKRVKDFELAVANAKEIIING